MRVVAFSEAPDNDAEVAYMDRADLQILTHSYSRTVMKTLKKAHNQNKRIKVYVTGMSHIPIPLSTG